MSNVDNFPRKNYNFFMPITLIAFIENYYKILFEKRKKEKTGCFLNDKWSTQVMRWHIRCNEKWGPLSILRITLWILKKYMYLTFEKKLFSDAKSDDLLLPYGVRQWATLKFQMKTLTFTAGMDPSEKYMLISSHFCCGWYYNL